MALRNTSWHGPGRQSRFRDKWIDFELDGRTVRFNVDENGPVVSNGDDLFIIGRRGNPFIGAVYFNETSESGSIDWARKQAGLILRGGAIAAAAGIVVVLATLLALHTERPLALATWLRAPLYIVTLAIRAGMLLLACGLRVIGMRVKRLSQLLQFVVHGS
ncbi:MAG TPA: hypothetical protein VFW44_21175 [Bryobacteraceae bacterium]|nr:hypothetical protein [Bryobacteraceae bacterium]